MASECAQYVPGGHVPYLDVMIFASRGEQATVGTEGHRARIGRKSTQLVTGTHIDQSNRGVAEPQRIRCKRQQVTVGTEREGVYGRHRGECSQRIARGYIQQVNPMVILQR